jgi:hypothetical protein
MSHSESWAIPVLGSSAQRQNQLKGFFPPSSRNRFSARHLAYAIIPVAEYGASRSTVPVVFFIAPFERTGSSEKLAGFIALMEPLGLVGVPRTDAVAISPGTATS